MDFVCQPLFALRYEDKSVWWKYPRVQEYPAHRESPRRWQDVPDIASNSRLHSAWVNTIGAIRPRLDLVKSLKSPGSRLKSALSTFSQSSKTIGLPSMSTPLK